MTAFPNGAAPDAPITDNPSGHYCTACRSTGLAHCAYVDECGGMRPMQPALAEGEVVVFHHLPDRPYHVTRVVPSPEGAHANAVELAGMSGAFSQHLFRRVLP